MRKLIDFVNHGILPFAGRKEVRDRLFSFWQETRDSHEARALLLLGESGMGKSRVIEEVIPRVHRADGLVVHVKLYPDSTIFLAPLIVQGLHYSDGGAKLLREEPEKTMPSVISALRRLARLRPLLLIIEDVHLLGHEVMGDFMALCNGLADEPFSILCAARPGDLPVRGVLAPYLVEEIYLHGLTSADLEELWLRFFETPSDPEIIDLFVQYTHGNPLALRTALRNALRSGRLARDERSHHWGLTVPVKQFSEQLADDVHLFSGGMTAHLNTSEKRAAALLATLGENFSRRSGAQMVGDEQRPIDSLIFKGILANLPHTVQPLCGKRDAQPLLGFTHTLIHDYLLKENLVDPDRLLNVIAGGHPLCSTVPFRLLRDHAAALSSSLSVVEAAVGRIIADVLELEPTADWRSGLVMLEAAEALFREREGEWSKPDALAIRLKLLDTRLRLSDRENHTAEYAVLVREFHRVTADIPDELVEYRLASFAYSYGQLRRCEPRAGFIQMWEEVEELLGRYPQMRYTERYVDFLQVVGRTTNAAEDVGMMPRVDEHFALLIHDPNIPPEVRTCAMRKVAPLLLWQFSSPEGLNNRLTLLRELQEIAGESLWVQTRAIAFYDGIGHPLEGLALADNAVRTLRARDMRRDLAQVRHLRLAALAALGAPEGWLERELQSVISEAPSEIQTQFQRMVLRRFVGLALSRDDDGWACRLVSRYMQEEALVPEDRLLLAFRQGKESWLRMLKEIGDDPRIVDTIGTMIARQLLGETMNAESLRSELAEKLNISFYIRAQVIDAYLLLAVIEMVEDEELTNSLRDAIHDMVEGGLRWLEEKNLPSFALPFLKRAAQYLSPKEVAFWKERFVDAERHSPLSSFIETDADERTEISVIGELSVELPDGVRSRVRGGRLRTIIGLLTANEMLPQPLSWREFCKLASGVEDDPERARKMSSMGLLRLREAYGDDIVIIREGESPSFNRNRVRIDLLEAFHLMRDALQEVHHGSLMRAHPALRRALELLDGEVPFPALYDDFFEAIRSDIDYTVREAVLNVGRGLVRENDHAVAEGILRLAARLMPEDEEIADLLLEVLTALGKRTEAERMKMRQAEFEQGW